MTEDKSDQKAGTRDMLRQGRLALRLLSDSRVPFLLKLIPFAAVIYLLSPVDLLPDVVPVITQIDDLAVMLLAVKLFVDMAPKDVVREYVADEAVSTTYRVRE